MVSELVRRRIAASANVGALAGAIGYVTERGYAHLMSSGAPPAIILREARIGYHLALTIAAFIALAAGLVAAELLATEPRVARAEAVLERVALPTLLSAAALLFVWP